jgi:WD40 repeat protein
VSGSDDTTLIVWESGDDGAFTASKTLSGHTNWVRCVAPLDGGRIVSGSNDTSGSWDKILIVWAAGDDGVFVMAQTLSGHTGMVRCVTQLEDRRLVSGSSDNTLKVWE